MPKLSFFTRASLAAALLLALAACGSAAPAAGPGAAPARPTPSSGPTQVAAPTQSVQPSVPPPATASAISASGEIDACALLTAQDAQSALGEAVTRSSEQPGSMPMTVPLDVRQCRYSAASGAGKWVTVLVPQPVSNGPGTMSDYWQSFKQQSASQIDGMQSVAGLGEDAFGWGSNTSGYYLFVRRGGLVFGLGVYGAADNAAAARTLAQAVLARVTE